jgi:nucleotidyltransferase/DNA polymerase involved in DNA repair
MTSCCLPGSSLRYLVVTANYVARKRGVTKLMGIQEARRICPDLVLVRKFCRHSNQRGTQKGTEGPRRAQPRGVQPM